MKVLKFLGLTLLTIIVLYVIIAAVSTKEVVVKRSIEVPQDPEMVFATVNDFNKYKAWNAWSRMDPNQTHEITGSGTAIGDKWSWKSDHPQVGNGSMEHKIAVPGKSIENEMVFEGMGSSSDIWEFEKTEDGGTKITWMAKMEAPFMLRPFFGTMMENGVGPQFDSSLVNLSALLNELQWEGFGQEEVGPFNYVFIKKTLTPDQIGEVYGANVNAIFAHLGKNNIAPAGAPMGIYYNWADTITMDICVPVVGNVKLGKGMQMGSMDKAMAATFMHVGPYEESEAVHYKMEDYLKHAGLEFKGPVVEIYYKNPEETPAEELETKIIYFIN